MRSINIEKHEKNISGGWLVYDAETGDPLPFIESMDLHIDVNGCTCILTKFILNEEIDEHGSIIKVVESKDGSGLNPVKEKEKVEIREIRMQQPWSMFNYYRDRVPSQFEEEVRESERKLNDCC